MDLISFLNQRKAFTDAGDADGLAALETKAADIVRQFLEGTYAAETETSPLFYSFFRTFAQTQNKDLKSDCEQAVEKLQPMLDEFDAEHNLTHLDELNQNVIEYNLAHLAVFERLNPFEKEKNNQLKFPAFADLLRLTDQIEITGSDENAHARFVETLTDASKLQAFMTLSLSGEKITRDIYLSTLRGNMENNLVLMFAADRIPAETPINEKTITALQAEYQKLLDALNRG